MPPGVQVRNLKEIAAEKHMPEGFAEPWTLPATAIQGYPHDAAAGRRRRMAPANPAPTADQDSIKQTGPRGRASKD